LRGPTARHTGRDWNRRREGATLHDERTKSGRPFRDAALQQCVVRRDETCEGLKTRDFPIALRMA
jgi:hypothetical protein